MVEIGDTRRLVDWQWVDGLVYTMFDHKYANILLLVGVLSHDLITLVSTICASCIAI